MSYLDLDDEALLARHRCGDERAYDALYLRYRGRLIRYAERLLHSRSAIAEDVVQEAFLRAHGALSSSERDVVVGAWLHRIVRNACLDELRRPAVCPPAFLRDLDRAGTGDVFDAAAQREVLRQVVRDITALPESQRDTVVGVVLAGRSHADLAARNGRTVSASKTLLARARGTLAAARAARGDLVAA